MAEPHRVMVRRFAGGLGDHLCALVAVRAARQKFPDSEIVYAVGLPYLAFVIGTAKRGEGATEAIAPPTWQNDGDAAFKEEWSLDRYDEVIDLVGEVEHAHQSEWNLTKNRQEIWCDRVGVRPPDMVPHYLIDPQERLTMYRRFQQIGLKPFEYIVVQWASNDRAKDYPHCEQLVTMLRDAGHQVVVMHHNLKVVPGDLGVYDTRGLYPDDCGIVAEMAKLIIAPDSFGLHLSAAVGCPAIGLFSSTDGALTCKYYPMVSVVQNRDTAGHPCEATTPCYGIYGRNYWCQDREGESAGLPWCLEQVSPIQVVTLADKILERFAQVNVERRRKVYDQLDQASRVKIDRKKLPAGKIKTLVVGVPAGIGDGLWALTCAQSIMQEDGADGLAVLVQTGKPARGREFHQRFDFVDYCEYADVGIHPFGESHINPDGTYNYLPTQRNYRGMDWLFVPNRPLELGQPLSSWLPEYEINWRVGIDHFRFLPSDEVVADTVCQRSVWPYVVFFLGSKDANSRAGHNRAHAYSRADWDRLGYNPELYTTGDARPLWQLKDWVDLGRRITARRIGLVLVGAKYDAEYGREFMAAWVKEGGDPHVLNLMGQTHIGETYAIIKRARCVFSYQSGVGIFSTFLGVPTAIWWRAKGDSIEPPGNQVVSYHDDMRHSWVPPWMLASGSFLGLLYGHQSPRQLYEMADARRWFAEDRKRGAELA